MQNKNVLRAVTLITLCSQFFSPLSAAKKQDINNYGKGALTTIPEDTKSYLYAPAKDLKWFQNSKFAVFVHWNPSCLAETEISWGRKGHRPGLDPSMENPTDGVPAKVYDNLYKKFNPTKFNADDWIRMVKKSGAKYFIFTTKHHDGFCMFDAKNTAYKITNTPFKRDICKELANACHKYGIKLFWYYSQPDWHNPDFLSVNHERYRKYVWDQLRQLLTEYGKVDGIWFDCLNTKWRHWNTPEMVKMIRKLQPGILINSRWGWGMDVPYNGDFDNPEQKLGQFKIDRPWETCATMGKGWSWRGGGGVLSSGECIKMLVQCVGAGGNLALDCGPNPEGLIPEDEKNNYLAMGKWLKKNGKAIYGTRGGPYKPGLYGVSCWRKNRIFIHILATLSDSKRMKLTLPKLPKKIVKAYTMDKIKLKTYNRGGKLNIDLSKLKRKDVDNIIVLEVMGNISDIKPIDVGANEKEIPIAGIKASSSYSDSYKPEGLISGGQGKFEAGIHRNKEWVALGSAEKPQWVELTLDKRRVINGLSIGEPRGRVLIRKYKLQYDDRGKWKTIKSGNKVGLDLSLIFQPIKTSKVRILIEDYAPNDPGLAKFKLYNTL